MVVCLECRDPITSVSTAAAATILNSTRCEPKRIIATQQSVDIYSERDREIVDLIKLIFIFMFDLPLSLLTLSALIIYWNIFASFR